MQNAECKMQNFGAYADFYCVLRKQNISHSLNISRVSISHRRYIAIIIANWKWQMANFGTALAIINAFRLRNISHIKYISHRRYIAIIIANWKWQMANFGTALAI